MAYKIKNIIKHNIISVIDDPNPTISRYMSI